MISIGSSGGAKKSRELMKKIREDSALWREYNRNMYPATYSEELTEKQECLVYGTLLGDGNIGVYNRSKNPLLQIEHSIKQEPYVQYKYSELMSLCKSKPKLVIHRPYGKFNLRESIRFQTRNLACLHPINDTVKDKNGRKTITDKWINMMSNRKYTTLSLSMWYLDDGSITHHPLPSGNKCTNHISFALGDRTCDESILLKEWLKREFNIASIIYNTNHICKNGECQKNLRVGRKENMIKLVEFIKPWVSQIPSMDYKIHIMSKNDQ